MHSCNWDHMGFVLLYLASVTTYGFIRVHHDVITRCQINAASLLTARQSPLVITVYFVYPSLSLRPSGFSITF